MGMIFWSKICQANWPRLLQHHAAVFRVGVIAEIGALVDEALAVGVDHDAERIGVLLEMVADREVAEFRRVAVPATAWQPDQLPRRQAPMSSAMRMPSPVLKRVPRTLARSQPGPR